MKIQTPQTLLAWQVANDCHAGQFRNDGITPYIKHPEAVAEIVEKLGGGEQEITVALLHDVLEDSDMTHERLAGLFDWVIADAVLALTHKDGESYPDSIERAKSNPIAAGIKIADNLANLSDSPSRNQVKKYAASLIQLLSE